MAFTYSADPNPNPNPNGYTAADSAPTTATTSKYAGKDGKKTRRQKATDNKTRKLSMRPV